MKVSEVIAKLEELLKEHGDLDVLTYDGNPRSVECIRHEVVEGDVYPDDWNMPEGFEYIEMANF